MLLRHLELIIAHKGERIAVREIRKHVGWYVKGMRGASAIKRTVNGIEDAEEMKRILMRYMEEQA